MGVCERASELIRMRLVHIIRENFVSCQQSQILFWHGIFSRCQQGRKPRILGQTAQPTEIDE